MFDEHSHEYSISHDDEIRSRKAWVIPPQKRCSQK